MSNGHDGATRRSPGACFTPVELSLEIEFKSRDGHGLAVFHKHVLWPGAISVGQKMEQPDAPHTINGPFTVAVVDYQLQLDGTVTASAFMDVASHHGDKPGGGIVVISPLDEFLIICREYLDYGWHAELPARWAEYKERIEEIRLELDEDDDNID